MKTRRSRASVCGSHLFYAAFAAILIGVVPAVVTAKSLYMVPEIFGSIVRAYDIGPGGQLTYQTEYGIPWVGGGAVGLAIDSDSQTLFVTYEYENDIYMLDATTMKFKLASIASGADNLAGIVYDHDKGLLYAVDRTEPTLYCYRWDSVAGKLTALGDSPFHLQGAQAFGIALDEIEDELYVGGWDKEVRVYSTADWSLVRTIPLTRSAISIAVDPSRGYLYAGAGYLDDFHLTQYDLVTGTESQVQVAPDAGVMGLAVDPATGFVYVTTGRENKSGDNEDDRNDLIVYATNLSEIQRLEKMSYDPTGIVIPGKHVSYNPLRVTKVVDDPVQGQVSVGAPPEIPVDGEFTYAICFEHAGQSLREVYVVDTLPNEIAFVRADGNDTFGWYDLQSHTFTWHNPPLSTTGTTCLRLTARVQPGTLVGTTVTNKVTIDSAQTPPTTIGVDAVVTKFTPEFKPLDLTKTVVPGGTQTTDPDGTIWVDPGEQITYRICYGNAQNKDAVNNVQITDELPAKMTFLAADGVKGLYDPFFHTYTWSHPSLSPGESHCVDLTVQLDKTVAADVPITNEVTIDSEETVATTASAAVTPRGEIIRLTKTITGGAIQDPSGSGRLLVNPGTDLTYQICIANLSARQTIENISIVDALPRQTTFVSAETDPILGYYDENSHTYTWFYGSLKPGTEDCLNLVVHVPAQTEPNTVITNSVTVTGKDVPVTTTTATIITPPDEPVVTVVDAYVFMKPTVLHRGLAVQPTNVMVVVYLPDGMGKELIADTPLLFNPGAIPAMNQTNFGTSSKGKIMSSFDPVAILGAIPGYGDFPVKITGRLVDGRTFVGKATVRILP